MCIWDRNNPASSKYKEVNRSDEKIIQRAVNGHVEEGEDLPSRCTQELSTAFAIPYFFCVSIYFYVVSV